MNETSIKAIVWQLENTRKILRKFKPYEKQRLYFDFDREVNAYKRFLKKKLKIALKNPNL